MVNLQDLKFMSIGGNCACIGFLGKNRIKGPVDNVIVGKPKCLDLLFSNKYLDYIINTPYDKVPRKKSWPEDYEFFSKYPSDIVWIAHHDPSTIKYQQELKKRCETFNNFYYELLKNKNYYFTFNLNEFSVNKKDRTLYKDFIEGVIEVLKKYNVLEKVIFVGTKVINNKAKTWNYNSNEFNIYIKKYNLKYVEIIDNNIWDTDCPHTQFINKVYRLLNNIKTSKWGNVAVCIAKNEELYINNWVEYHLKLGFDKIFIYDNNDLDKEDLIHYIKKHLRYAVTIISVKGKHEPQLQQKCYNDFILKYNRLYDWCAFLDVDEFIYGIDNINYLLEKINKIDVDQIRIKWNLFGDDNVIQRDLNIPVFNFFTKIIKNKGKYSNAGKCIIKGKRLLKMNSVHYASYDKLKDVAKSCYPSGKSCLDEIVIDASNYKDENIYINHYMTKTLDEFMNQKFKRTDAVWSKKEINLDYFFNINKFTDEKKIYLKERWDINYEI